MLWDWQHHYARFVMRQVRKRRQTVELTYSHRAFSLTSKIKAKYVWLMLTHFSTLESITNSPKQTHWGGQATLEPESQTPTPPGAAPIRTPGCELTHCFLVSDPWSQDFLGLAAKRVLPDSLPTGYWGISRQIPRPHHCPINIQFLTGKNVDWNCPQWQELGWKYRRNELTYFSQSLDVEGAKMLFLFSFDGKVNWGWEKFT